MNKLIPFLIVFTQSTCSGFYSPHLFKKKSILIKTSIPTEYITIKKSKPLQKKKRSPVRPSRDSLNINGQQSHFPLKPFSTIASWLPLNPRKPLITVDNKPRELICEHFDKCAGCSHDRGLNATPIMEQAKSLLSIDVKIGEVYGWRTLAKLAAMPLTKYAGVKLGLYEKHSHVVLPIPHCAVHHPKINVVVAAIESATFHSKITAYRNETGEGMLRYVQLAVERSTELIQVTFVWNANSFRESSPYPQRLVKLLRKHTGSLFHSIWIHFNHKETNSIFIRDIKKWHRFFGPEFVGESLFKNLEEFKMKTNDQLVEQRKLNDLASIRMMKMISSSSSTSLLPLSLKKFKGANINKFHEEKTTENKILSIQKHSNAHNGGIDEGDDDDDNVKSIQKKAKNKLFEFLPKFYFSPLVFRQANLEAFRSIIARIAKSDVIKNNDVVCELYAGIGLIGLSLFITSGGSGLGGGIASLRCSDENPANERAFQFSLKSLPYHYSKKALYFTRSAEESISEGQAFGANVLIVDPPRHGLDQFMLNALCDIKDPRLLTIEKFIYISCNFIAMQIQLPILLKSGWRLELSEGYALFPGSNHIETLVVFSRIAPFHKAQEIKNKKLIQSQKISQRRIRKERNANDDDDLDDFEHRDDDDDDDDDDGLLSPIKIRKPRKVSRNLKEIKAKKKAEKAARKNMFQSKL